MVKRCKLVLVSCKTITTSLITLLGTQFRISNWIWQNVHFNVWRYLFILYNYTCLMSNMIPSDFSRSDRAVKMVLVLKCTRMTSNCDRQESNKSNCSLLLRCYRRFKIPLYCVFKSNFFSIGIIT